MIAVLLDYISLPRIGPPSMSSPSTKLNRVLGKRYVDTELTFAAHYYVFKRRAKR